jgi:hypothetical protein
MVSSFESQEDALFDEQVKQVTQWWKASSPAPPAPLQSLADPPLHPVASLCWPHSSLLCSRRRLEEGNSRDPIPVRSARQEALRDSQDQGRQGRGLSHLRSVRFPLILLVLQLPQIFEEAGGRGNPGRRRCRRTKVVCGCSNSRRGSGSSGSVTSSNENDG